MAFICGTLSDHRSDLSGTSIHLRSQWSKRLGVCGRETGFQASSLLCLPCPPAMCLADRALEKACVVRLCACACAEPAASGKEVGAAGGGWEQSISSISLWVSNSAQTQLPVSPSLSNLPLSCRADWLLSLTKASAKLLRPRKEQFLSPLYYFWSYPCHLGLLKNDLLLF